MRKIIFVTVIAMSLHAFSDKHKAHREHDAHVHGGATLNIAFDQLNGKIEFKGAAESVLGFEHGAKSDKDKKKLSEAVTKFETGIASMVVFDAALNCVMTKELIEVQAETKDEKTTGKSVQKEKQGEHSNFVANFNVVCAKSIVGSKVTFNFTSFQRIKDLDVTVLADAIQKTAEVKKKPVTLEIK